jgi:hypothetical protein
MDGKLQPVIDALITHYQAEKMKAENGRGAVRPLQKSDSVVAPGLRSAPLQF